MVVVVVRKGGQSVGGSLIPNSALGGNTTLTQTGKFFCCFFFLKKEREKKKRRGEYSEKVELPPLMDIICSKLRLRKCSQILNGLSRAQNKDCQQSLTTQILPKCEKYREDRELQVT